MVVVSGGGTHLIVEQLAELDHEVARQLLSAQVLIMAKALNDNLLAIHTRTTNST